MTIRQAATCGLRARLRQRASAYPDAPRSQRAIALGLAVGLFAIALAASAHAQGRFRTITLAWDANREPIVAGYLVYVGIEPNLPTQVFDVGSMTSFKFLLGIHGVRYYFSVAAYTGEQLVGPRSAEVEAVAGATAAVTTIESLVVHQPPAVGMPTACVAIGGECVARRVRASGLGEITAIAATADGIVFAVEDGRRIRALADDQRSARIALEVSGEHTINGIVLDGAYETSRHVFVSTVTREHDASRLTITRYREVARIFAEAAVIVASVPFRGSETPRVTVDRQGNVFVAVPAADDARDPYAGRVLRFRTDGSAGDGGLGGTPVWAQGLAIPSGLHSNAETLILAGRDPDVDAALVALQIEGRVRELRAGMPLTARSATAATAIASPVRSVDRNGANRLALVDAQHRVWRATFGADGLDAVAVTWPDDETPLVVHHGQHGELLVVVRVAAGGHAIVVLDD